MKKLVVCGNCEVEASTSIRKWTGTGFNVEMKRPGGMVQGEITPSGDFLIKRWGDNSTKISGNDFSVICGKCGNYVYKKQSRILDITYKHLSFNWVGSLTN